MCADLHAKVKFVLELEAVSSTSLAVIRAVGEGLGSELDGAYCRFLPA